MRKVVAAILVLAAATAVALGVRNAVRRNTGGAEDGPASARPGSVAPGTAPVAGPDTTAADTGATTPPVRGQASAGGVPGAESPGGTPSGSPAASAAGSGRPAEAAGPPTSPPRPAGGGPGAAVPPAGPPSTSPGTDPQAQDILRKAAAAYEQVRSLRAEFSQELENPLLGSTGRSRGTLFQRRPDRFLMRFADPAGDVIVSDGRYFWVYYPSVDDDQVIRMPAAEVGATGVDLQAQFVGDPTRRFSAALRGREDVRGRSTYVLDLDPRADAGYRALRVWVDARDYLVRRFQITEESGVIRRIELHDLQLNPQLGDDLFRFTPPAGARVIDRG